MIRGVRQIEGTANFTSIMSPHSIAAPTLHNQAIAGRARTIAMESITRAAPKESRKRWECLRTIWALHRTPKAPSMHMAIDRANIRIKLGGNNGSSFYRLIRETG